MSNMKPIKLYSHASGPNPWKVAIILEELGLPYDTEMVDFSVIKKEPFINVNPNGRVPAIEDPNTGLTLWESGAIVEYLIDTYDKSHALSYTTQAEKYKTKQWLFFQVSGQGPYYGQGAWFAMFHHEKLPSAQERYQNEVKRVTGVLNTALEGKDWLVGDKCTYADLMFVTWQEMAPHILPSLDVAKNFPNVHRWLEAMKKRPATKKVLEEKAKAGAK